MTKYKVKLMIGNHYRPIDGEVVGELTLIDPQSQECTWFYRGKAFQIPYERFMEYFCEAMPPVTGS